MALVHDGGASVHFFVSQRPDGRWIFASSNISSLEDKYRSNIFARDDTTNVLDRVLLSQDLDANYARPDSGYMNIMDLRKMILEMEQKRKNIKI